MKKLLILLLICITNVSAISQNWLGTFDGKKDASRLITRGDNILTVTSAYVWDNGEGKSPEGNGSDRAWYGIKHGPYGNLHLVIYAPDQQTELVHTRLHGAWETGDKKWEWLDNEGVNYINYGIYDWDAYNYEKIFIVIYESDPKDVKGIPIGFLREHDVLMRCWVNKEDSYCGVSYSNYYMPTFTLQTVDLNYDLYTWTSQSILKIVNKTGKNINVYVKVYTLFATNEWGWTEWYGPYSFGYNETQKTSLITSSDNWTIKGTYLYIYAENQDGYSVWNRHKSSYISIKSDCNCPSYNLANFIYTFR